MSENILTLPADHKVVVAVVNQIKSDLRGGSKYGAYVAEFNVTHEDVKVHAAALAALVTPVTAQTSTDENGTKVRTRYGNAVQAAGNGLRAALGKKEGKKDTDWIRLVMQAAGNAHEKGGKTPDQILAAVREALGEDDMTGLVLDIVA